MNIKKTVTTIALAVSITLGGAGAAQTAFAGPESSATAQSGHSTRSEERGRSTGRTEARTELRGEGEWMWLNYSSFDLLLVSRIDFDSASGANFGAMMMIDGGLLEDAGFEFEGTFRIRDIDGCDGIRASLDGQMLYIAICVDGKYVSMIGGTDKDVVLDIAEQVQDGYEPVAPRGYEDFEG